jgi:hypothetical protein
MPDTNFSGLFIQLVTGAPIFIAYLLGQSFIDVTESKDI